ncbi:hypothetical protein M1O18_01975 [Dehalococcoidia bacterium]|nr:hypothetical protein [Dehalococcoidia bacterium]
MKKYASDDFGVPSVTEGASGMMWDGGLLEEIYCVSKRRFFDLLSHSYSLFHIHFHSSYGHPIRPSLADMYAIHSKFIDSTYESGEDRLYEHVYEVRTIDGIAQIDPRGNVDLLLIQPLKAFYPGEGEEAIFEQLLSAASTEEIAKLLTDTGVYRSQVVHFKRWQLAETDRENLGTFTFTPRPWGVDAKMSPDEIGLEEPEKDNTMFCHNGLPP